MISAVQCKTDDSADIDNGQAMQKKEEVQETQFGDNAVRIRTVSLCTI